MADWGVIALEGHCPCEPLSMGQTQVLNIPISTSPVTRGERTKNKTCSMWSQGRSLASASSEKDIPTCPIAAQQNPPPSADSLSQAHGRVLGMLVLSHGFASSLLSWQHPQVAVQCNKNTVFPFLLEISPILSPFNLSRKKTFLVKHH